MKNVQYVTRTCGIDAGHRVMNEAMKCFNVHGHRYEIELTFSFENQEDIGYAIDFKEIKRVGCQWIDDILDHGMILNPEDTQLIETTKALGSKLWLMSLNGSGNYCNPTVENVAREVFLAMEILFDETYKESDTGLKIHKVTIYETPNCWTEVTTEGIPDQERVHFYMHRYNEIMCYASHKGVMEYDERKLNNNE